MANLTVDPSYCDSYSECSSSNSGFSYGMLTPTSSAGYSAATSRRQSIVSEGQSCSESAFNNVPTFSSDGMITPLETPPPFSLSFRSGYDSSLVAQGYDTESSPQEGQHQTAGETISLTHRSQIHDGFNPRNPGYAAGVPGYTEGFLDDCQQTEGFGIASRSMPNQLMDFSTTFSHDFEQCYDQNEPAHRNETMNFDISEKLDFGYANPDLSPPMFLDISAAHNRPAVPDVPQTIAPQNTFVDSNFSFTPSTPICEPPQPISRTPFVKTEDEIAGSPVDRPSSAFSSLCGEGRPGRGGRNFLRERRGINKACASIPTRSTRSNGINKRSKITTRLHHAGGYDLECEVVPKDKKHHCVTCDKPFDRPEHYNRHMNSIGHMNELKKKGKTIDELRKAGFRVDDAKTFKCKVPKCAAKNWGVTRHDNLKPHYTKTHFYNKHPTKNGKPVMKDGKRVEVRKRNEWVSVEGAIALGLAEIDPRTKYGRQCLGMLEPDDELSDDMDE
ncbi:MAG: hypothetical protein Q9182_004216 [Xanthomendoza sp. 2 TL-2023]